MKEKRKSKWLSLLLAGVMALTLFSGMAMAEEPTEGGETQTVCTLTEGCTLSDGHDGACVTNNAGEDGNEGQQGINLLTGAAPANAGDVAQIGAQTYPTLEDAVAAVQSGETIVLLQNASGNGIKVPENSSFTLDLGGYTYTVNGQTVGSTGTETLGFQLLKGSTITIKNGAIAAQSDPAYPVGILIQNYSNLTLDNVQLTGDKNTGYVLSNNFGDTVLKNNTVINATDGNVAFDVYYGMSDAYKDGVSVTIEDSSVQVTGKIEYGMAGMEGTADEAEFAAKASLNIPAGYTGVAAPDGYEWVTTSGGAQKLQNTSYVAKVGDVAYPTLEAAVAAAQDGQTVTLLNNAADVSMIQLTGKKVVVDLNGHEVGFVQRQRFNITNGGLELTGTGRVYEQSPYYAPVMLNGFTGEGQNVLVVGQNVVLEGWAGVFINQTAEATNYNASVTVNGTIHSILDTDDAAGHGVYVNGTIQNTDPGTYPVITLSETSVITSAGNGIYAAGYAEWNLSGQITGAEAGVEIRAGIMNVTGGKIVSTGTSLTVNPNGNGSTTSGAGLAVAQHTTRLPIQVNVSGGEIEGYAAFYESDPQGMDPQNISLNVTGGDFNAINGGTNAIYSEDVTGFITGGTYSHSVNTAYIAVANMETQENGRFVIVADPNAAVAEANGSGFTTLQAAIDAAAANGRGTVTLLKNTQENIVIPAGADITLNLSEGVTLTNDPANGSNHTIINNGSLTVTGSGTVDNVTHARAALVNYGTAVLEGGLFTRSAEASTSPSNNGGNSYYVVYNRGDMTITGTAVVRNKGHYSSLICNYGSSEDDRANLIITGGKLEQDGFIAVKNDDYGNLTISGGVISSGEQAEIGRAHV